MRKNLNICEKNKNYEDYVSKLDIVKTYCLLKNCQYSIENNILKIDSGAKTQSKDQPS